MQKFVVGLSVAYCLLVVALPAFSADPVRIYYTNRADATFTWDYDNATANELAGFKIFVKTTSANTPSVVAINDPAARTYQWTAFPSGQCTAWMTALDRYGNESEPSETIEIHKSTTRPSRPSNNRVDGAFVIVIPGGN